MCMHINNYVGLCLNVFIVLYFLNLVYQNGTLKCFVYINNDQLWITVLEMVCVQTLSICVYSKHRLAKLMLNGRCKWHRKWQPSVTDGCLICLLVFCSLLWITVIWTAASANLFLFNYAVFIMSTIREDFRKCRNWDSLCRWWYILEKFHPERSDIEWGFILSNISKEHKDSVSHGHCDKCTMINDRNTVSRHVSVIQMLYGMNDA